ncbi:hypothetical protein FRC10_007936 [Ceratobasidium sp. 414]|nr:hypothetical protein FRC10_007936 [Ceratobasidium sp. 414]
MNKIKERPEVINANIPKTPEPTENPLTPEKDLGNKVGKITSAVSKATTIALPTTGFSSLANDNLPSPDAIVAMCIKAGFERTGIPLHDQSSGDIVAWVKYSPNVTMHEAATQNWVAQHLDANPEATVRVPLVYNAFSTSTRACPIGFIVMEYIDAPDCTEQDVKLVAQAVQTLISIRGPTSVPGHVDGGPIVHTFFVDDWTSPFIYKTVDELERHVNGIVALDFDATCFLPPSFIAVAMAKAWSIFAQKVAMRINYPKSEDAAAMVSASYFLVPFGRSDMGPITNQPTIALKFQGYKFSPLAQLQLYSGLALGEVQFAMTDPDSPHDPPPPLDGVDYFCGMSTHVERITPEGHDVFYSYLTR